MGTTKRERKFRTRFDAAFVPTGLSCGEPSLAQQNFKDEVDINYILEKFKVTGQVPQGVRLPEYGDFTGITNYRQAMDAVLTAREEFLQVPAKIRERFGHSPQAFLDFCSDPANKDELVKMGLSPKVEVPKPPEPTLVRVVPEPKAKE